MELNDRQRKLLFAGIAVALVVLGLWLTWPRPDTTPVKRPPAAAPTAEAVPTQAPTQAPAPGITATVGPEGFDIYRLLRFSRTEFATAASVAQRFTAAYGTYRFDEDPQTYLARLRPSVVDQLFTDLAKAATTPGELADRKAAQTVAVGSASLNSIADIGDTSIIFMVTGVQQVTKKGTSAQESKQFRVTVQRDAASWRVYGFEPADVGQAGDP
ncbi:MAG: hypothetical protein ABIS86_05520 [Streptosporangiaceae bacterium]